jgi:hypothetical protein
MTAASGVDLHPEAARDITEIWEDSQVTTPPPHGGSEKTSLRRSGTSCSSRTQDIGDQI